MTPQNAIGGLACSKGIYHKKLFLLVLTKWDQEYGLGQHNIGTDISVQKLLYLLDKNSPIRYTILRSQLNHLQYEERSQVTEDIQTLTVH